VAVNSGALLNLDIHLPLGLVLLHHCSDAFVAIIKPRHKAVLFSSEGLSIAVEGDCASRYSDIVIAGNRSNELLISPRATDPSRLVRNRTYRWSPYSADKDDNDNTDIG
jgi:hypothetical protein